MEFSRMISNPIRLEVVKPAEERQHPLGGEHEIHVEIFGSPDILEPLEGIGAAAAIMNLSEAAQERLTASRSKVSLRGGAPPLDSHPLPRLTVILQILIPDYKKKYYDF